MEGKGKPASHWYVQHFESGLSFFFWWLVDVMLTFVTHIVVFRGMALSIPQNLQLHLNIMPVLNFTLYISFPSHNVVTSNCLITVPSNGCSSASALWSSLNGGSLTTAWILATFVLITPLYGPPYKTLLPTVYLLLHRNSCTCYNINVSEECVARVFHPEDVGSMFLWNVNTHLPDCMVSKPRRLQYKPSLPWKFKILHLLYFFCSISGIG
jgi:hypothetical protein